MELWQRHNSPCPGETIPEVERFSSYVPVPIRLISCFNASARLCTSLGLSFFFFCFLQHSCLLFPHSAGILSNIVETIYAVHPPPAHSRHTESALLEKRLDKWFVELPEHLQISCASTTMPLPHVLTLHMQYWCSVLLVHRPL